jgi:hypothetical protein
VEAAAVAAVEQVRQGKTALLLLAATVEMAPLRPYQALLLLMPVAAAVEHQLLEALAALAAGVKEE